MVLWSMLCNLVIDSDKKMYCRILFINFMCRWYDAVKWTHTNSVSIDTVCKHSNMLSRIRVRFKSGSVFCILKTAMNAHKCSKHTYWWFFFLRVFQTTTESETNENAFLCKSILRLHYATKNNKNHRGRTFNFFSIQKKNKLIEYMSTLKGESLQRWIAEHLLTHEMLIHPEWMCDWIQRCWKMGKIGV